MSKRVKVKPVSEDRMLQEERRWQQGPDWMESELCGFVTVRGFYTFKNFDDDAHPRVRIHKNFLCIWNLSDFARKKCDIWLEACEYDIRCVDAFGRYSGGNGSSKEIALVGHGDRNRVASAIKL